VIGAGRSPTAPWLHPDCHGSAERRRQAATNVAGKLRRYRGGMVGYRSVGPRVRRSICDWRRRQAATLRNPDLSL